MSFTGSCHCGQVTFTCADAVPRKAMTCNCSICSRKGAVLHFTAPDHFQLTSGEDVLKSYEFNKHIITHYFCSNCGSNVFARVAAPDQPEGVAINLRCADVPLEQIKTNMFDGASQL